MNQAPIVTVDFAESVQLNTGVLASQLFSVSDPDGDAITRLRFTDLNGGAATGFFRLNNTDQVNGSVTEIAFSELANLAYFGGAAVSNEFVRIQAFDGIDWSVPVTTRIFTTGLTNQIRPTANVSSVNVLANENRIGDTFISASDPDGFPILRYFLRDRLNNQTFFTLNGVEREQGEYFNVEAADLQNLVLNVRGGGRELIDVFAWDGARWSTVDTGTINIRINEFRPTIVSSTTPVSERQSINLADVVQASDADGNTIKFIELFDTSPHGFSGFLVEDGVGALESKVWHRFSYDELDQVSYVGAGRGFTEQIRARVFDGGRVSTNTTLFFETISETQLAPDRHVHRSHLVDVDVSDIFSQFSNLDRPFLSYEFVDTTEVITNQGDISGRFELGGVAQDALTIHSASQQEFVDLEFRTGTIERRHDDEVYVRGFDGQFYSDWTRVSIRTEPHYRDALKFDTPFGPLSWAFFQNSQELTFSFMTDPGYTPPEIVEDNFEGFQVFSETQRAAVRQALDHISNLTNLTFREVADDPIIGGARGGTIRFGNFFGEDGPRSHAESPNQLVDDPTTDINEQIGGDIWFNLFSFTTTNYGPGSRDYTDLLEDLGIALGLKQIFAGPGVTLPAANANDNFSVLSLPAPLCPIIPGQERPDCFQPSSFSLYDVINLQDLYGANTNTRTGDDVYSIASFFQERDDLVWSIWDAGGRDTLSAVGSSINAIVDLREGNFSSIGILPNNISIAFGTQIEDAVGSINNDTITGNSLNNFIDGLDGQDAIWGGAGDDVLTGGVGNDRFFIGIGDDDDIITENRLAGRDTLELLLGFPGFDSFSEDLSFRTQGRDLVVDLTLDGGRSESSVTIRNQKWGAWRVESLQFGSQRVDLTAVYDLATNQNQNFRILSQQSDFGFLVEAI